MNGILVVNKPSGFTSHQVVAAVRRLTGIKKVGHTGTLDPEVRGVLPLCIGSATRVAEYMLDQSKAYHAEMTFGFATNTQDSSGTVTERVDRVVLNEEDIRRVFARFTGTIVQTPPAFSAVKIQGKRAYDLARQGVDVEIPQRQVTIHSLQIEKMDLEREDPKIVFTVECSKGTYVRTLCHDIGRALGVPAHMSQLIRTRSGPYRLEDSYTLEEIDVACAEGRFAELLLSASTAVSYMPLYRIKKSQEHRVANGMPLRVPYLKGFEGLQIGERIRVEDDSARLLAVYRIVAHTNHGIDTKPEKVFRE
ncbi:tRNA pseudouridine synthase B [Collibacillus ludicampi]|uniref:tRNA pseudouridine synthase B n=1 Tax=Collibacillus ludicampi TaxID=2771369 RepID=A0AAV4LJ72_9BACL|nr:tRNA pseudouridine(55) synthase TruB [Collibacillus ludicampi]GIM47845.1 tRNA pseudouridine synthase B [Collibacillus ludicampi]